MSIFKTKSFSLLQKSAAFLLTVLCCFVFFPPTNVYASEADSTELLFSQNLYHKHTGSSSSKGGCYTVKKTRTTTEEVKCQGTMVYWPDIDRTSCDKCGGSYSGDQSGRECWETTTKTVTETYYVRGCNMTESTQVGTLTVRKSTDDWAKSLTLQASYDISDTVKVNEHPFIWNEADATADSELVVTENGTYTLRLNTDSNVDSQNGVVTVPVSNIDVTGPVLRSYALNPILGWTKNSVTISKLKVEDLQPNYAAGCGKHEKPFSYDGGVTWTATDTHVYTKSGSYEILVRDKLENVSKHIVPVNNIDITPPAVFIKYDPEPNKQETLITVQARDFQPGGADGCGLHEKAFSFDGGKNWSAEQKYTAKTNGVVKIAVRDKLENTYFAEEEISNIDDCGPQLEYTIVPESWTNQSVTVQLKATDKNADGSNGIGLPPEWYSLDGGSSWLSENTLQVDENKTIAIILRDLHNNQTRRQIVINNIDKQKPEVSIQSKKAYTEDGRKIKLIVNAKDTQSGLHEKAYSWNGSAYSKQSTKYVSSNGTYVVKVRDMAGNTGYASINVDYFPKDKEEEGSDSPDQTEEETTTEPEEPVTEDNDREEDKEENDSEEDTQEFDEEETGGTKNIEETGEETVLVTLEERIKEAENMVPQELKRKDSAPLWKWLLAFLSAVLLLLGTVFLFLAWIRTIAVYVMDCTGKMCYQGRLWIRSKDARYEVEVSEKFLEKCETTHFCFKPAWGFVQLHEDVEMYFYFPEDVCISHKISEQMKISLF